MNLTVSMAYQKVLDAPLKYRLLANCFTQVLLSYTKYLKFLGLQSYGFSLSNTSLFAMLYNFFTFLLRSPKKKFDFQNLIKNNKSPGAFMCWNATTVGGVFYSLGLNTA